MVLQSIVAGTIVAICLGHLGRSVWRGIRSRGRAACGGCSSCESTPAPRQSIIKIHRRPR